MDVSLITAQEAADILKLKTPDKVYLLVRSKLIRGFKFGRRYLIDRDSVFEYCRCQLGYLPSVNSDSNSDSLLKSSHYIRL